MDKNFQIYVGPEEELEIVIPDVDDLPSLNINIQDDNIVYEVKCSPGKETYLCFLLASVTGSEAFDEFLASASQLENGDEIIAKLAEVMEKLEELKRDEDDYPALKHPVSVFDDVGIGEEDDI